MAPVLAKSLSRLSRDSLVQLCLQWSESNHSTPYLTSNRNLLESDEEDYLHEPAENIQKLRSLYEDIRRKTTGKDTLSKRDIIDRIVDGDWRRGLSLHQLATIDFAHLEQNETSLRWSALKLVPLEQKEDSSIHLAKRRKILYARPDHPLYPQTTPTRFLTNLKAQISPLVKAHCTIHRLPSFPTLSILRLYIVPDTAFAPLKSSIPRSPKEATDAARVMYIALPDSCPYVYVSIAGSTGSKTLSDPKAATKTKVDIATTKRIILEAIPKALSRSQERWSLESTKLTTKSLKSICLLRGNDRPGTAGGVYSKFSEDYPVSSTEQQETREYRSVHKPAHVAPLHIQLPSPPPEDISSHELKVHARFGSMHGKTHASLDRFTVKLSNILNPPSYIPSNISPSQSSSASKSNSKPKKRKRLSLEEIENGIDSQSSSESGMSQSDSDAQRHSSAFSSHLPAYTSLQQDLPPCTINLTFTGTDVFAGLKQLALLCSQNESNDEDNSHENVRGNTEKRTQSSQYVDLDKMPAWATGGQAVSSLVV